MKVLLATRSMQVRVALIVFAALYGSVAGAELTGPDAAASPGATAFIPLSLASHSAAISAIQFDVLSDGAVTVAVLPGGTIETAGKTLYKATVAPRTTRYLVVGLNKEIIDDGVLARVFVSAQQSAAPGKYNIALVNAIASSPDGHAVAVNGRSIAVTVQADTGSTGVLRPSAVVNAASGIGGAIAPGEVFSMLGAGTDTLAPKTSTEAVGVFVNDLRAPLLYVGPKQINAVVPFGVEPGEPAVVEIRAEGNTLQSAILPIVPIEPGIFTQDSTGRGAAAVLNEDYSLNAPNRPADRGSVVMIYGTGFGQTEPSAVDGEVAYGVRWLQTRPSARIGGVDSDVTYAGFAPGLITGMTQINVRVPYDAPQGPAVPLLLHVGGTDTQRGVTMSVR